MTKLGVQNLAVQNKKVLVRVDFNVPQDKQLQITDDSRISAALPTIEYLLQHGAAVILMSHLGRPKGKPCAEFSLSPCAKRLSELLKQPVIMAPDCIGPEVAKLVSQLLPGQVLLLENLRFHLAEEKPETDPDFAKELARLGDLYVNDAFGTAHRAHASTVFVPQSFPGKAAAGFLLQREVNFLSKVLLNPERPFHAIIGGAKISSKLGVLRSLVQKADALYIGGGMAYTFMKAQGIDIGDSIHEDSLLETAKSILSECQSRSVRLFLPLDLSIATACSVDAPVKVIEAQTGIPEGFQGFDIGPRTIKEWSKQLQSAKTIFWNGPVGVAEVSNFAKGTREIAQVLADLSATTIVGGGDSVAALQAMGLAEKIDHVSTGGGASLEYIELGRLPGIDALSELASNQLD